jgi:uroporphyrinogen decarboxylase
MRQAGRYLPEYMRVRKSAGDFLSLCYTPELSSEVTLQPVRRFGLDAAIIFSDILVIPDALGQCVTFAEGKGPLLSPIRGPNQVERLDQDGVDERLAPVYQAIQRVRRDLSPDIDLIGFAGAPWTVATYMVEGGVSRDFSSVKGWAFSAPNEFQRLIDILVDVTASHLISQVSAGADALQIFDTWAGALPEPEFIRWCIEPVKEIVSLVRNKHPEIPIIGFPRGVGVGYKIYGLETGVSALSIDSSVPLSWAAKELQPNCVVQGNLDPVMLMAGGSAMVEAARNVVSTLGEKGFVFNLGHGIIRTTPPDHVAALVDAVRTP